MFWELNQLLAHPNVPNDDRPFGTARRNPRPIRTELHRIHVRHMPAVLLDAIVESDVPQADGRVVAPAHDILAPERMVVDTLDAPHVSDARETRKAPLKVPAFDDPTLVRRVHNFVIICCK